MAGDSSFVVIMVLCLTCLSCGGLVTKSFSIDNDYVYDKHGMVSSDMNPLIIDDKERVVVTYLDIRVLDFVLGDTPRGKIDKNIHDNPDWNFLFVINAQPDDSLVVVSKLNQYGCGFPVIFDCNHKFMTENNLDSFLATTYVYEGKKLKNLGVIGDSKSFFDEEFEKYKKSKTNL